MKDIAIATGYSINTVSRALKDMPDVRPETKRIIRQAATRMAYIRNGIAGSLRTFETKTIAVILGDISNPYFAIIVRGIEDTARQHGYHVLVINTDEIYEREAEAVEMVLSKGVDGIVLLPVQAETGDIKLLQEMGVPFVLLGRHFSNLETNYVISDDRNGAREATRYLLKKGHQRILYIAGPRYVSCAKERLGGHVLALQEAKVEVDPALIRVAGLKAGSVREIIRQVVIARQEFSAISTFSDYMAFEAIHSLKELGLRVPEDVAVIGYDDVQSDLFLSTDLTTVHIPKYEMAVRAFEILYQKMQHEDASELIQEVFPTRFVVRRTA